MTSKTPGQSLPVTMNLKRTFENAVRDIYETSITGKPSRYRMPIARRARISESPVNAEKRALSDAAKALAQLWKVTPSSSR